MTNVDSVSKTDLSHHGSLPVESRQYSTVDEVALIYQISD